MSAIEQELIDKIRKLDDTQKIRVLEFVRHIAEPSLTLAEWLEMARQSRAELREVHGDDFEINVQALLDEVREERGDDLLGGR